MIREQKFRGIFVGKANHWFGCNQETLIKYKNLGATHGNCIKERASYGDKQYPEVARYLGRVDSVELNAVGATWHLKCHKDAVHADKCQRAKRDMDSKYLQSSLFLLHRQLSNSSKSLHSLAISTI